MTACSSVAILPGETMVGGAMSTHSDTIRDPPIDSQTTGSQTDSGKKYRFDVADGKEVIWMSERDGWNHLYLIDGASGAVKNQITKGAWPVRGVLKVDPDARQIWFTASGMYAGKDPYFSYVYRIDFDGSGLARLTADADANHVTSVSSDQKYFVDTYSRVDVAPVSELRTLSDGALNLGGNTLTIDSGGLICVGNTSITNGTLRAGASEDADADVGIRRMLATQALEIGSLERGQILIVLHRILHAQRSRSLDVVDEVFDERGDALVVADRIDHRDLLRRREIMRCRHDAREREVRSCGKGGRDLQEEQGRQKPDH